MTDELRVYTISFAGFFQYFTELLNPIMSFVLLTLTILYTYQKYKTEKKKNENE